jgi:hypothetical protein
MDAATSEADLGRIVEAIKEKTPVNEAYDYDWADDTIFLKTQNEGKRIIGHLKWSDRGIIYWKKVERAKHFFRHGMSWGLNAHVIRSMVRVVGDRFRVLLVVDEGRKYWADGKDIAGKDFMWFKAQGFERQIMVPENLFKEEARDEKLDRDSS